MKKNMFYRMLNSTFYEDSCESGLCFIYYVTKSSNNQPGILPEIGEQNTQTHTQAHAHTHTHTHAHAHAHMLFLFWQEAGSS